MPDGAYGPSAISLAMRKRTPRSPDPFDPLDGTADDVVDLHGFRADEVRTHLPGIISRFARQHPHGLLHIITGKGRRSPTGPVLKSAVRALLREPDPRIAHWAPDLEGGGFLIRFR